jgi:excisionase family DNA binding protein
VQAEITREWVTYKQAEELSGLSRTTLWKLLSAGEIKAARVGRRSHQPPFNRRLPRAGFGRFVGRREKQRRSVES